MSLELTEHRDPAKRAPTPDLWATLRLASPEMAKVADEMHPQWTRDSQSWGLRPGFRPWLMSMFALGWPSKYIKRQLESMREEQVENGDTSTVVWPAMSVHNLNWARNAYEQDWMPLQVSIAERIHEVGVMDKAQRLLSLQRNAEALEAEMWEDRDRQNRLYLVAEWRALMRQIAEELGQVGEVSDPGRDVLAQIALKLAESITGTVVGQGRIMQRDPNEVEAKVTEVDAAADAAPTGAGGDDDLGKAGHTLPVDEGARTESATESIA